MSIEQLQTPCLLLDESRMQRNISRMKTHLAGLNVSLRPHVKTAKSIDVARHMMESTAGPITVSTLKEAEQFFAAGVTDILYAVGIAPSKLERVVALRKAGADLSIILDTIESANALVGAVHKTGIEIPVLIEIDSDGHRAGIEPGDPLLLEVARILTDGQVEFRGVMTHAGSSYDHPGEEAILAVAEMERHAVITAANMLRQAGIPCPVVSVGSTPTARFSRDLSGVTEVRAGVFVFNDLVMAGLGVCSLDDIAISVLASVIGHQRDKGWIIVDAGWMAMSRDRGTASQPVDQGYGIVTRMDGTPYQDLIMEDANQEHGILAIRPGSDTELPDLPVGSLVRILPNHACATSAQFDCYHVFSSERPENVTQWQRFSGW